MGILPVKGRNSSSGRVGTEDAGARRRGSSLVLANPLALPSHQAASASTEALTELLARKTLARRVKAVPFAAALSLATIAWTSFDRAGIVYATASGALTSGVGYAIWYTALKALKATHAATVQLSVPAIAALGGVLFLGEPVTVRLVLAATAILGGIALVIVGRQAAR